MPEHFNGLTPAEAERLAMLSEECGEVIQIIGKILRHGYDSYHPDDQPGHFAEISTHPYRRLEGRGTCRARGASCKWRHCHKSSADINFYLAHPASILLISACPVTSDKGPPSRTSAAAWSARA